VTVSRRVAVLSGGRSSEHDVSVDSARSVARALAELGYDVVDVVIDREGAWAIAREAGNELEPGGSPESSSPDRLPAPAVTEALARVDVVFPVLHGPFGEDGTVQGLLELAGVPYVGPGVAASALCMDKDLFKAVMRDRGIPVTRNITLREGDLAYTPYGYPVFVKPARLGSSVGITKAHDDGELEAAAALAFEHDDKVLVEELVDGVEVEVGVLGNRSPIASLPGEIVVTNKEWYDYEAKYAEGEMELVVPARISAAAARAAQELAVRAFVAAECEGMARVDMFVRGDSEVLVNELNTIPGFTGTSVYAKLFEASRVPYPTLLERLIELALERHERRRKLRF
jgi:D-alanine-D-alanine ligase